MFIDNNGMFWYLKDVTISAERLSHHRKIIWPKMLENDGFLMTNFH